MELSTSKTNHFGPVQPGAHIDTINDLTQEESLRQDIPEEDDLQHRDCIQVVYQSYSPETNSLDALHDKRLSNVEEVLPNNTEHLVTTDIVHGDLFKFTYASGTWKFVGAHVVDDQTMLFVPADEEARNAPLYPAYKTFLRADFAAKLGGRRGDATIERIQPPIATLDSPDNNPVEPIGFFTRLGYRLDTLLGLN